MAHTMTKTYSRFMGTIMGEKRSVMEIFPIVDYDVKNDCYKMASGYLDIQRITAKDLFNLNTNDVMRDNNLWAGFHRMYSGDLKIVGINQPTDTQMQQSYVQHLINHTNNEIQKQTLEIKLKELKWIEKNSLDRAYYLFFFGKTIEELLENRTTITQILGSAGLAQEIDRTEKEQIFFQFNNMNSPLPTQSHKETYYEQQEGQGAMDKLIQKKGKNPFLIERIGPIGGITFKGDRYFTVGTGYMSCIDVRWAGSEFGDFWLCPLMNIPNSITTVDLHTKDKAEVKKNLGKSMKEQRVRFYTSKEDTEMIDAQETYQEQKELYQEISLGEIVKDILIRVYVYGVSANDVDTASAKAMALLREKGFTGAPRIHEGKNDWLNFYRSFEQQKQNNKYFQDAQGVTSGDLAPGNPFYFSSLSDPYGMYYGYTPGCNGKVMLDIFHKDKKRLSYDCVVIGKKGSGKSTFLKKTCQTEIARGNYIRGFDPTNEWTELILRYGGEIVSLDGSDGIINMWEIFKTAETDDLCFMMHLSKLDTIYKCFAPDSTAAECSEFQQLARKLYVNWGLIQENPSEGITGSGYESITGLPPETYPIFSDFYNLVKTERQALIDRKMSVTEREANKSRLERLGKILLVIENIIHAYGFIFDGHTTVKDILRQQIVFFNTKYLRQMKDEVFTAQMCSALSLCWQSCVSIGESMKQKWENGQIAWEDIKRCVILIDEAHFIVNTSKPQCVMLLLTFIREGRKYFTGIIFATQSIRDLALEGATGDAMRLIVTLLDLVQYKFILQHDSNAIETLERVFRNQLNETELDRIPQFGMGDVLLCFGTGINLEFRVEVSRAELALFSGGA